MSYATKLEEEEIKNPYLVLYRFFDYANINSQREHLWEWLKITVSGTFSSELLSRGNRYDMIYFYEHLEKLIEAAHLINLHQSEQKNKKKKKQKQ